MCFFCVYGPENLTPRLSGRPTIALILFRFLLIVLLFANLVLAVFYFVVALNAVGNDIDWSRESHLSHKPHLKEPYMEDHFYGVTKSISKDRHITVLIVWTVVTMIWSMFAGAGLIGAMALNSCLVFCYIMIVLGIGVAGYYIPYLQPHPLVAGLVLVTVAVAVLFITVLHCCGVQKPKKGVKFSRTRHHV